MQKCVHTTAAPDLVVVDQLVECNLGDANIPEGSRGQGEVERPGRGDGRGRPGNSRGVALASGRETHGLPRHEIGQAERLQRVQRGAAHQLDTQ